MKRTTRHTHICISPLFAHIFDCVYNCFIHQLCLCIFQTVLGTLYMKSVRNFHCRFFYFPDSPCPALHIRISYIDRIVYSSRNRIDSTRMYFECSYGCHKHISQTGCYFFYFCNIICSSRHCIFPHVHRCTACMICLSLKTSFNPVRSFDPGYNPDLPAFLFQHNSLFNMKFNKFLIFICVRCLFQLFRMISALLHCRLFTDALIVCIFTKRTFHSKTGNRLASNHSRVKSGTFFICKEDHFKRSL